MRPFRKTVVRSLAFAALAGCNDGDLHTRRPQADAPPFGPLAAPEPNWPNAAPTAEATPEPTPAPPSEYPRPCHAIYDPASLPTFELEISDEVWNAMEDDGRGREEWRPASFRFEGTEYPDVMVRKRGNYSSCGSKLQFAVAFHHVDPEGRFQDLKRLNFDHGSCRILFERVAMEFVREELGIAAPCANNARVLVNGEFYGLFANVEHQNKDFLKRNFPDPDGNLYKVAEQKKTNEDDPDVSDLEALHAAHTLEELDALVDLEQAIRMWAAEALLPAEDNFWYYDRNFYVYNHPGRGFLYLPNDYDRALPMNRNLDWDPTRPIQRIPSVVLDDPEWNERFENELREIHSRFRPEWFDERLDRYWMQVKADVEADPFFEMQDEDIARLKEWIRDRERYLDERLQD